MIADQGVRNARLLLPVAILSATACGAGGEHDEQVVWALVEEPVGTTYELRAAFGGSSCTEFRKPAPARPATAGVARCSRTWLNEAYAEAQRRGYEIVHPLTEEPWGVRRFFVRAPDGTVFNVVSHRDE